MLNMLAVGIAVAGVAQSAWTQTFPIKPVRMVAAAVGSPSTRAAHAISRAFRAGRVATARVAQSALMFAC